MGNADGFRFFLDFVTQYEWLKADLEAVDRRRTPWVVAYWHNPFYCSNVAHNNSAWLMKDEYEALLVKHGVNLVVNGHVHAYERTHPIQGITYAVVGTGGNG